VKVIDLLFQQLGTEFYSVGCQPTLRDILEEYIAYIFNDENQARQETA
jgi:hypothetical protein